MGHKTNPLIFRSKLYPFYKNIWNETNKTCLFKYINLKQFLKENSKLLDLINIRFNYFKKYYLISLVVLSKKNYIENKYKVNTILKNFIKKNYITHTNYCLNIVCLENPLLSTSFLIRYISNKLSSTKLNLRKFIPHLILLILYKYKLKGVKFIISGRINGVQMAKTEIFRFYKNSGQSKTSLVKYGSDNIKTKYGVLGIKLWLFLK